MKGHDQRVLLVANPIAGGGKARASLLSIVEELARLRIRPELLLTQAPWEAAEQVRALRDDYELVVVSGGDGTVNEVVNGMAGSVVPLAIIPTGTQNVLARELAIPDSVPEAVRLIQSGHTQSYDLGNANGRYFILWSGIGFDAHVAARVDPALKRRIGAAAFLITGLSEAHAYEPVPIRVAVDGRESEANFVVVSNGRYYSRYFELMPQASMRDGYLDVSLFRSRDILSLVRHFLGTAVPVAPMLPLPNPPKLPRAGGPKHGDGEPAVETLRGREILVTAERAVPAHVDCEILGPTPVAIRAEPGMLRLRVPRESEPDPTAS